MNDELTPAAGDDGTMTNDELNRPRWMSDPDAMPSLGEAMKYSERVLSEGVAERWMRGILAP